MSFKSSGCDRFCRWVIAGALGAAASVVSMREASAQTPPPHRSGAWGDTTTVLALSSFGVELLMPRVFYSDPEVTVGWKARWHVSVLAPSMTLAATALLNERFLKPAFKGFRPGCDDTNQGLHNCESYGMLSTHSFTAFSSFGQGLGVFLVDTIGWSGGRLNVGSLLGNVAVPGVLGVITTVGRTAGNFENGGQAWAGAGVGALLGLGMGVLYAAAQRPECGYGGDLICW
ncbi:MAG TPA: hypothetical protein VMI54_18300 [Polyangiaceae bacterium]|nr:hypothetical protein [Polyangiaceae bacterium]